MKEPSRASSTPSNNERDSNLVGLGCHRPLRPDGAEQKTMRNFNDSVSILRGASIAGAAACAVALVGCGGSSSGSFHSTAFYVTNAFSYTISQFKIAPDGSLSQLAP